MRIHRRQFLTTAGLAAVTAATTSLSSLAFAAPRKGAPKVVVIGGGFGGATAAKYLKLWAPDFDVTLVERGDVFVSCPQSNLLLSGGRTLAQLTTSYDSLRKKYGIRWVKDEALAIDSGKRQVRLRNGKVLAYDRLILSPGIDLDYSTLPGLASDASRAAVLHAWKAGAQTVALRKQLEAIPDGGNYVLTIPSAPYRCPPGPYERVSLVASYFKQAKPKSRIIVLDANPDIVSKKGLFTAAWNELYPGVVDYRANTALRDVDAANLTAIGDLDNIKADVLNVVPPQKAGAIAHQAGVIDTAGRWASVDFVTYESRAVPGIHVIGDATLAAPAPKSGHVANQHGKVAAAAVIALLRDASPYASPVISNTCYSFVSNTEAIHVAAVYRFDPAKNALITADGTGVSAQRNGPEADYAHAWARNIWADALL